MTYADLFSALGDPVRAILFERLRQGPQSVGGLAAGLPVSRPAVSQHLKCLREAGLVALQPVGTRNLYRIDGAGVARLRDYLQEIWDESEAAHAAEVARQMEERRYG